MVPATKDSECLVVEQEEAIVEVKQEKEEAANVYAEEKARELEAEEEEAIVKPDAEEVESLKLEKYTTNSKTVSVGGGNLLRGEQRISSGC